MCDRDEDEYEDDNQLKIQFYPQKSKLDAGKIPNNIPNSKEIVINSSAEIEEQLKINVEFEDNRLKIKRSDIVKIMNIRIKLIINHIKGLINKYRNYSISTIILTGGFGCSKILKKAFREAEFMSSNSDRRIPVFTLNNPELSVVNGAVLYGYNPNNIVSGISPMNYFIDVLIPWKKTMKNYRKITVEGRHYIKIHKLFFKKGEKITDKNCTFKILGCPVKQDQEFIRFELLSSDRNNFDIDNPFPFKRVGYIDVDVKNLEIPIEQKVVELSVKFASCIYYEATNIFTHKKVEARFRYEEEWKN